MATVAQLLDYLTQFSPSTIVVLTEADVQEPCEFIALDNALAQLED